MKIDDILPLKREGFLRNFLFEIKAGFFNWICKNLKANSRKIYLKEKRFCIYDKDEQIVQKNIKERKEKAEKFEQVKAIAPIITRELYEKRTIEDKLSYVKVVIEDLYVAYYSGDSEKMLECFNALHTIGILDSFKINKE